LTHFDLVELARTGPVHFMGIGGAGMAPLAELVLRSGGRVTGCDTRGGEALRGLVERGAEIYQGHDPAHVTDVTAVVITAAVAQGHPEVEAALGRGVPVVKRAEALGSVVNRGTAIGVAGTHGKTTTTTLTTAALAAAGFDPTGLVGGRVPAWGGNLRAGGTRFFVVEADEFDRSFLSLRPHTAVVTTLEADHLDTYGSLDAVEAAFLTFVESVPADGEIIGCGDDSGVGRLFARVRNRADRVRTYGTRPGSMMRIESVQLAGRSSEFRLRLMGRTLGSLQLQVPGIHNVRNATAAAFVAHTLGGEWRDIAAGIAEFTGVERRFEPIGSVRGIDVVDDYAHHPTEVAATLSAARSGFPDARLVAVFQPHLYTRTRDFAADFGRALALADEVFVADVYAAREEPIPGVTGELVAEAARAAGARVTYLQARATVPESVAASLREGDLCLTLGAGDLDQAARDIVALLGGAAR
jgi:UDP-N-acetylmuramate--alanine ligase